jgi:hypothetical protein
LAGASALSHTLELSTVDGGHEAVDGGHQAVDRAKHAPVAARMHFFCKKTLRPPQEMWILQRGMFVAKDVDGRHDRSLFLQQRRGGKVITRRNVGTGGAGGPEREGLLGGSAGRHG